LTSLTLSLLKTLGSPLLAEEFLQHLLSSRIIYKYTAKNKIGLLYLEDLKKRGMLGNFEDNYLKERRRHHEFLITITRAARMLSSAGIRYAVFKSIFPYPAIPNDVDILVLGNKAEFRRATKIFLGAGYQGLRSSPNQMSLHDRRNCVHADLNKKDVYDVDLYQEVAASYLLYLDKARLFDHLTEKAILGERVNTLTSEAELLAIITHSVIPEQIYTLSTYFAVIYNLAKMDLRHIDKMMFMAKENNVTCPIRVHFSLTAALHQAAFGIIPRNLTHILTELGEEKKEVANLLKVDFKMPFRYSLRTIVRTLMEKSKDCRFRKSAARQVVAMLDPRLARWVANNIAIRRKRETY